MYEEILEQMQELLKDESKNFNGDFSKLEQKVMAMMMSFGKGLLQRLVDSGVNVHQGSSILCKCDNSRKFVQHRHQGLPYFFSYEIFMLTYNGALMHWMFSLIEAPHLSKTAVLFRFTLTEPFFGINHDIDPSPGSLR